MVRIVIIIVCFLVNNLHAQNSSDFMKIAHNMDKIANYKEAIKNYKKALELEPDNTEILEKLVFAKSNNSKYRSAIDDLNNLIVLQPESSKFHFLRGFLQFNLKNYLAAISDYSKAIEFEKDKISNCTIYSERGLCKMRLNDYEGALADFNLSLSIYQNSEIIKYKKETESKLQKIPTTPKYRAVQTNVHHIVLKKTVLNTN